MNTQKKKATRQRHKLAPRLLRYLQTSHEAGPGKRAGNRRPSASGLPAKKHAPAVERIQVPRPVAGSILHAMPKSAGPPRVDNPAGLRVHRAHVSGKLSGVRKARLSHGRPAIPARRGQK